MADPSVLPPFVPPPAPPADLVIDTFGTFLGKRSGRMLVRWRDPTPCTRSPLLDHPDPFGPPPEEPARPADSARGSNARTDDAKSREANARDERRPPAVLRFPRPDDRESDAAKESTVDSAVPSTTAPADSNGNDSPSSPQSSNDAALDDSPDSGTLASREPEAVAARLLSLWSRRRSAASSSPGNGRRRSGGRGVSEDSAPGAGFHGVRPGASRSERTSSNGEADVPSDHASPHDRFQRLDATLRELDADFDSTPGNAWRHCEVPLDRLKSVVVASRGVSISSDLVEALVERGVQLSFLSSRGTPVAHLNAPALAATVQTRRSQLAAYATRTGVELAAAFIDGKVRNQRHTLLYFGKYLKASAPDRYRKVFEKAKSMHAMRRQLREVAKSTPKRAAESSLIEVLRDKLMGFEGAAARSYWEAVAVILEGRIAFPGRETRGALDPVNAALNYGYGILYSQVFGAVVNAGLEPYAGFLHVDRPGKPSLVLDLVEEFRAPIVDRAVLAIVNQGIEVRIDEHGLVGETKRLIADRVLERLNKPVPFEGKRHRLRAIVQMQARHLATAVRGERVYKPFCSRW
jgi:CRISPR-associated protein Cas1